MLSIKPGVTLNRLSPQIVLAVMIANEVYKKHGADLVITSGDDGKHLPHSLHYQGHAVDLRIWTIAPSKVPHVVKDLRNALGANYDVVLESDHIHIEYDPD